MSEQHTPTLSDGSAGKRVIQYDDLAGVAHAAAELFVETAAQAQAARGVFRVALSGGSTPRRFHELLAGAPYRDQVNWARVEFYWGDERTVPPDDAESNYHMAYETLLRSLLDAGLARPEQIHRMQGELSDHEAAARSYEDELRKDFRLAQGELPRFDLIYLGMGPDGHTLSLFPGTAALHVTDRLVVANDVPQQHTTRITLTAPVANNAALVVFLIAGADKADALQHVLRGRYDPDRYPSQLIKPTGGELRFLVDRAAVGQA
jgi:6-phosphogluconolactonase